jgi:hypothetical protein
MGTKFSSFASPDSSLPGIPPEANEISENAHKQPVHIEAQSPPRFEPDDPKLCEYLAQYGYVVIKSVASEIEIARAKELCWSFLKISCGMEENNQDTWSDENFCKVGSTNTGILSPKINHSSFLWFLRLLPRVKQAFAQIYNTSNLLTSYDGGNVFRPWHITGADEYSKTSSGWFHGKTYDSVTFIVLFSEDLIAALSHQLYPL